MSYYNSLNTESPVVRGYTTFIKVYNMDDKQYDVNKLAEEIKTLKELFTKKEYENAKVAVVVKDKKPEDKKTKGRKKYVPVDYYKINDKTGYSGQGILYRYMTKSTICSLLGVPINTWSKYKLEDGFPTCKKRDAYDTRHITWYVKKLQTRYKENFNKYSNDKNLIQRVKAEKMALELAVMKESLISSDEAQERLMQAVAQIKTLLLDVPGKLAPQLENKTIGYAKNQLERTMIGVINGIADYCQDTFKKKEIKTCLDDDYEESDEEIIEDEEDEESDKEGPDEEDQEESDEESDEEEPEEEDALHGSKSIDDMTDAELDEAIAREDNEYEMGEEDEDGGDL